MTENILTPEMNALRPDLGLAVSILEEKAPYGAVSLSSREYTRYLVDNNQESVVPGNPTAGVILTAFDGHTMREKGMGGFNREDLLKGAKEFVAGVDFKENGKLDPGQERVADFQTEMEHDPALVPTQEKLDFLRKMNQRVKEIDPRIVNARVNFLEMREKTVFRNRTEDLAQDVQRLNMSIMVTVMGEKGVVFDWTSKCGTAGLEIL